MNWRPYYKLVDRQPVRCSDPLQWALWFQNNDRRVRQTRVGPYEVSTIFLGLDHSWRKGPPVLFETMVFITDMKDEYGLPKTADYQRRCCTWSEAEQMHERAIQEMREHGDPVEQIYPVPVEEKQKCN